MNFIIYLGLFTIILGVLLCGVAVWTISTHREKKYNRILNEHLQQSERVKNKLER